MRLMRQSGNRNILVGIFLLVLLAIFAGPGFLPNLLPTVLPWADEGIPCQWLRAADDRARHQSILGRRDDAQLSLRVRSSALPSVPGESLVVNIIITNRSIGTIAIVYNQAQVRWGDDGVSSGLGLVPNALARQALGTGGQGAVPATDVRLLGPRQSCVHEAIYTYEQIGQLGLTGANNTVKAYYRNTNRGIIQASPNGPAIFGDLGLWVGITESDPVPVLPSTGVSS